MTRPDIHQIVQELCDTTTNREPYTTTRGTTRINQHHTTTNIPLITQLHAAILPSNSTQAGTTRPATSRPAARIDAIDALTRIHQDAAAWLHALNHPTTGTTIQRIRRLASLTPQLDPNTTHTIHTDIHRWWTWARITTGWDVPAWAPDNTCPLCATRGTLRIRLIQHIATCIDDNCRATWDATTIGLLADHIRTENGEAQAS